MGSNSHGLRSDRLREDAYWAEVDQILLSNLRETLELQKEAQQCAANGRVEHPASPEQRREASFAGG